MTIRVTPGTGTSTGIKTGTGTRHPASTAPNCPFSSHTTSTDPPIGRLKSKDTTGSDHAYTRNGRPHPLGAHSGVPQHGVPQVKGGLGRAHPSRRRIRLPSVVAIWKGSTRERPLPPDRMTTRICPQPQLIDQ